MPEFRLKDGVLEQLTPQEEAALIAERAHFENNIRPINERRIAFKQAMKAARTFDPSEFWILLAAYDEVKRARLGVQLGADLNSLDTPAIDAYKAVFPFKDKLEIADEIETRVGSFIVDGSTALAQKIKDGG